MFLLISEDESMNQVENIINEIENSFPLMTIPGRPKANISILVKAIRLVFRYYS